MLCLDGTRRAYDQAAGCNWGKINSHIVMTSAIRDAVVRTEYINLIRLLSYDFGAAGAHTDLFRMFESMSYGRANLMFTDETKELVNVAEVGDGSRNTYYGWVGQYQSHSSTITSNIILDLNKKHHVEYNIRSKK